ncbi:TonB-dependent receptor [Agaribacter flavus]|uniref:TonB-dependent receptor domain-containing protein n=1 Tax=Agaribacter flavus TaxID=1902781 RepID=A0ABV7FR34_9ALTE
MRRLCSSLILLYVSINMQWVNAKQSEPEKAETKLELNLEEQSLTQALIQLGQQANLTILFSTQDTSQFSAPSIQGKYTLESILQSLLVNSSLHYTFVERDIIAIGRQSELPLSTASSESSTNNLPLQTRTTTAREESLSREQKLDSGNATLAQSIIQGRGDSIERIVITGSKLKRSGKSTNVPVTLVNDAYLSINSPNSLASTLLTLPALSPSGFSGVNTQSQTSGGAGLEFLNLRGLGTDRTLVLVNGKRHVGARRGSPAVDINSIPEQLIERIEISTGGASAVYGADAVAGVVNIILKDKLDGQQIEIMASSSSRKDAHQSKVSFLKGDAFFNNKLHATISASYEKSDGLSAQDRSFTNDGLNFIRNPASAEQNDAAPTLIHRSDIRFNTHAVTGSFEIGDQLFIFSEDGQSFRPFDFGEIGKQGDRQIGGDGVLFSQYDNLRLPIERHLVTSMFDYEFDSTTRIYADLKYASVNGQQASQPTFDPLNRGNISLSLDNPFISPNLRQQLLTVADFSLDDKLLVNRVHTEFGRRQSRNDRHTFQSNIGMQGELNSNWQYEIYATFGRSKENTLSLNSQTNARFFDSIDAIFDEQTGEIVCRDLRARMSGCQALNIIGINQASREAIEYSRTDVNSSETLRQTSAGLSLTGVLAELPAGSLNLALGSEYRKEFSRRDSSQLQASGDSFLPPVPSNEGQYEVFEAYAEAKLPIVSNQPYINNLALEGAVRLSNYNTSGGNTTWHGILNYAPKASSRFRITRSKAARAPNIAELFEAQDSGFSSVTDPCSEDFRDDTLTRRNNCDALGLPASLDGRNSISKQIIFEGNAQLKPEESDTWTAGLVYTPAKFPNLSFTADYWQVDITRSIDTFSPQTIVDRCVDDNTLVEENVFCSFITRDENTQAISTITTKQLNIGEISARGVDLDLHYSIDLASSLLSLPGLLQTRVFGTYLDKLQEKPEDSGSTSEPNLAGTLGYPRWQANSLTEYKYKSLTFAWQAQFIGSAYIDPFLKGRDDNFIDLPHTGTKLFHDFMFNYEINDSLDVRLLINNAFDNIPPRRGLFINQGRGLSGIYRNTGAHYSIGLTYRS